MILEKSMGNPFVWKVVVLSWGKLDALLLDTWKISRCQNQNGCQTQTITTHLLIKKRFCRLLLSYEIHWITCAVRHRMTDDQDQHKHTLSFLKSVLSFSKPQLSFQKIETPRILLSIAVNFGCSSYNNWVYIRNTVAHAPQSDAQAHLTSGHRVEVVDLLGKQWPYLSHGPTAKLSLRLLLVEQGEVLSNTRQSSSGLPGPRLKWHERHREETKMSKNHFTCGVWGNSEYPNGCSTPFNTAIFLGFIGRTWRVGHRHQQCLESSENLRLFSHHIPFQSIGPLMSIEIIPDPRSEKFWEPLPRWFRDLSADSSTGQRPQAQDTTRSILEASGKRKNLEFWWMLYTPIAFPSWPNFCDVPWLS